MKVIALTLLTTLSLAAAAQAFWDYELQCSREEIGIRWPSYYSNSDYYVCSREGGRQLTITCPPGEVFTFVLQTCTTPNKFIPPPPLNTLPISQPSEDIGQMQPIQEVKPYFPKPIHVPNNDNALRPPVVIDENQNNFPIHAIEPPSVIAEPLPVDQHPAMTEEEEIAIKPNLPAKPHPPSKPAETYEVPMPPTPPPTPKVVPVTEPSRKKLMPPLPSAGKKAPAKPKGDTKKQPPIPKGKKAPSKEEGNNKKQPPRPSGKKQMPSLPQRA